MRTNPRANISEHIWRCTCGGAHFISIERHDFGDDDPECAWLTIEDCFAADGWRNRLRLAWRILREGTTHGWSSLELSPAQACEIRDELVNVLIWWEERLERNAARRNAAQRNTSIAIPESPIPS